MTTKDIVGLGILGAVFAVFILILVWTVRPHSNKSHSPEQSIFVQQRVKNLDKSNK